MPDEQKNRIDGRDAAGAHVVALVGVGPQEAAVEVVHEVRRAPVEVREDRRRVRGDEAADHQADEADRQELQHRRDTRCRGRAGADRGPETPSGCRQLRVDEDRAERHEDPGPRPQHVVRDVEEEHGAERVLLRLRREHALRDVAAAARLRARIPDRPPLHRDRHDEHGDRDVPVVREVGQDVQVVDAAGPAHRRQLRRSARAARRPAAPAARSTPRR